MRYPKRAHVYTVENKGNASKRKLGGGKGLRNNFSVLRTVLKRDFRFKLKKLTVDANPRIKD